MALATVVALLGVLGSGAADATPDVQREPDHRHCVSTAEFNSIAGYILQPGHERVTRSALETKWDMVGWGIPVANMDDFYGRGIVYRRCGYPLAKIWYGVKYWRGDIWLLVWGTIPPPLTSLHGYATGGSSAG